MIHQVPRTTSASSTTINTTTPKEKAYFISSQSQAHPRAHRSQQQPLAVSAVSNEFPESIIQIGRSGDSHDHYNDITQQKNGSAEHSSVRKEVNSRREKDSCGRELKLEHDNQRLYNNDRKDQRSFIKMPNETFSHHNQDNHSDLLDNGDIEKNAYPDSFLFDSKATQSISIEISGSDVFESSSSGYSLHSQPV